MITIDNVEVLGWEAAIRGMRNPMNSWDKSDSKWCWDEEEEDTICYVVGDNDLALMQKLADAGPVHGKFLRMITVYMDITAPRYWWAEYDTYKVGTVANSCSTMHKIHAKELTLDDFSHDYLSPDGLKIMKKVIGELNFARTAYVETNDQFYFHEMIQLLPSSYNQKRTVMLNYEVLRNMYNSRKNHKLDEWRELCRKIEELPYSSLITGQCVKD